MLGLARRRINVRAPIQLPRRLVYSPKDTEQTLRANIRGLGAMLGKEIQEDDPEVFKAVERLRALGNS